MAQEERRETLTQCVKSFKHTSPHGPSGLKASHLKDMLHTRMDAAKKGVLSATR